MSLTPIPNRIGQRVPLILPAISAQPMMGEILAWDDLHDVWMVRIVEPPTGNQVTVTEGFLQLVEQKTGPT